MAKAAAQSQSSDLRLFLRRLLFGPFLDGLNALPGLFGVVRIGISEVGLIVINEGALPAFLLFVKARDLETAARLLALERALKILRFPGPRIVRVDRHKIIERRDGLAGDALVVFGLFGLLVIGDPGLEERFGEDLRFVVVTVGGPFVG